jgi:hypothetical protein
MRDARFTLVPPEDGRDESDKNGCEVVLRSYALTGLSIAPAHGLRAERGVVSIVSQTVSQRPALTLQDGVIEMRAWKLFLTAALAGSMALVYLLPKPAPEPTSRAMLEDWDVAFLRALAMDLLGRETADGSRSLLETAALFGTLNRLAPEVNVSDFVRFESSPFPVHTDAERLCAQVIYHVRGVLQGDPAGLVDVEARLVAEFSEALLAHGAIQLPDASTLDSAEILLGNARRWHAEQVKRRAAR